MPCQSQFWACVGAGYTNLPAQQSSLCSSRSDKYKGSVFIGNSRSAVERQEHPGLPRRSKGLRRPPSRWNQNKVSKGVQDLQGRQRQGRRHVPDEGVKGMHRDTGVKQPPIPRELLAIWHYWSERREGSRGKKWEERWKGGTRPLRSLVGLDSESTHSVLPPRDNLMEFSFHHAVPFCAGAVEKLPALCRKDWVCRQPERASLGTQEGQND